MFTIGIIIITCNLSYAYGVYLNSLFFIMPRQKGYFFGFNWGTRALRERCLIETLCFLQHLHDYEWFFPCRGVIVKVLRYLKLCAQRWQPMPKCKRLPVKFRKQCLMNFQQSFVLARNTRDASTQNMHNSFSPKASTIFCVSQYLTWF